MRYIAKYAAVAAAAFALLCSCDPDNGQKTAPKKNWVKGADIGWCTEMESKGYKFYNAKGQERECTALMKELGFNAVRYRVWVNPEEGWNSVDDVLVKCLRAKALGMDIMIDFHYSDNWADPGKQYIPDAWKSYDLDALAEAVAKHTSDVLNKLKDNAIEVKWVQVGNEVTNGMLWELGRVQGTSASGFAKLFKAGADAVKSVYPEAKVVLHIDNAWKTETLTWFYDLMVANKVEYDVIGLSLYPSYWDDATGSYNDWHEKVNQVVSNIPMLGKRYDKEVLLTEWGMPQDDPAAAKSALKYLMNRLSSQICFKGIFYWEPESEKDRNGGYSLGAFEGGKPTAALDPFLTF